MKIFIAPTSASVYIPRMSIKPINAALIVAAGRGTRMAGDLPKQYRQMPDGSGLTVLAKTLSAFATHAAVSMLCVIIHKDDKSLYENAINELKINKEIILEIGGETRQTSVLNGLKALADKSIDNVLIHDAARPYLSAQLISACLEALETHPAVIPALPVTDTLKKASDGLIVETVARADLWRAQTPQAFRFQAILEAHQTAPEGLTDDAAVAEAAGLTSAIISGEADNIKLTFEEDFQMPMSSAVPRTGNGYDVHRFGPPGSAQTIMLGGIEIAHNCEIIGHSDADIGLHAITDALYGALAEGDIGDHFPPSDAANKDRASSEFLAHAVALAQHKQARLTHIDLTFICESPKIGPHRTAMRAAIAELTGLSVNAISVKATTTEKLGFTGRGEGIAAQATVTLLMPEET